MAEKKVLSGTPIVPKVDYTHLESLLSAGTNLFAVKNTMKDPFVYDWNLELLPEDLEAEFDKYLEKKYVEYGRENLIGRARMVSLFENGKTINFLNSFLTSKKFPVVMPRQEGKEEEYRSTFVINAGESVILTEKQAESLRYLEKVKRVWEKEGVKTESPWLGFLIIEPIQDVKDLLKYSISYVTSKDAFATAQEVGEIKKQSPRAMGNLIRAKS